MLFGVQNVPNSQSAQPNKLTRRHFLWVSSAMAVGLVSGCVAPPVAVPTDVSAEATSAPAVDASVASTDTVESSTATRTVTHPLGTTEVPVAPQRVIAMHNEAVANIMLQLGFTPLASVNGPDFTTIGDVTFPESVVSVGAYNEPNLEQIAALSPDLIISSMGMHDDIYEKLSAIASTVPVYDIGAEDALATSRTVADLIGKSDVLEEQIAAYNARVADIRSRLEPILDTLEISVFGVYGDAIITSRHPGWTSMMVLNDLGITWSKGILANSNEESFSSLSFENVPELDGDVIFIIDPNWGIEDLQATGILETTFAAKAGQLFLVDDGPWYRGGIAGLNLVLDDVEASLLGKEIDTSGDFR